MISHTKVFRYIFWAGYLTVLIAAFFSVKGDLNKINIGTEAFHIRLDHLLHLFVYFLICMYFLFGQQIGLTLFKKESLRNFIIYVLLLATVTELVQLWVPKRAFNVFDLLSNVGGVFIGLGVIRVTRRENKR